MIPQDLLDNRSRFETLRQEVRDGLLPRLKEISEIIEKMDTVATFEERLHRLGHLWDESGTYLDKAAYLAKMMSLFSIPREHIYFHLIQSGAQSKEMKLALYRSLAKLFKQNPAWRPFLDRAARSAGVIP